MTSSDESYRNNAIMDGTGPSLRVVSAIAIAGWLAFQDVASGWGLRTHRWINEQAAEQIPGRYGAWLRERTAELRDLSVEPDVVFRERDGRIEAIRHFMNLDAYGDVREVEIPRDRREADEMFGRDVVDRRGTLPWEIMRRVESLRRALRASDGDRVLEEAGLLGHYVADAFMPLHAVSNFDGQLTNQAGLHARLERGLVDAHLARFVDRVGDPAAPSERPISFDDVVRVLRRSAEDARLVIEADAIATREGLGDEDGSFTALDRRSGDLLARRLRGAVEQLSRIWLSEWIEAGRPTLSGMKKP